MGMHLHHTNPVDHITLGLLYPRSFLSSTFLFFSFGARRIGSSLGRTRHMYWRMNLLILFFLSQFL